MRLGTADVGVTPGWQRHAPLEAALRQLQSVNHRRAQFGRHGALSGDCRLVLIDDVLTSGATVEGCAWALLRAGAANVDVLIFARVAEPGRTSI